MFKKTTLKNGLRIITVPQKNTEAVTVLVLVKTGSKYETKEINGISHFLEHMYFKGTKKRPSTLAIAETLDKIGGIYNAFTSEEYTGYYAKTNYRRNQYATRPPNDLCSCVVVKALIWRSACWVGYYWNKAKYI